MNARLVAGTVSVLLLIVAAVQAQQPTKTLRAGMIGLETSHVPAFARLFNDEKATGDLAGIKVVAGYPGGTDIPASRDRVKMFTDRLREMGIEIVDTIPKLLPRPKWKPLPSWRSNRDILPDPLPTFPLTPHLPCRNSLAASSWKIR